MKQRKNLEELKTWINDCYTVADVCRKLDLVPYGENYARVKKIIDENQLDISHFRKGPWNKGKKIKVAPAQTLSLQEILVENSPQSNNGKLKKRLWKAGLKEQKCEICGYTENLELHHINGQPTDNRLENLQILCPNCHAKTENFRGKNISHRNHKPASEWFLTEDEVEERREKKLEAKRQYGREKYGYGQGTRKYRHEDLICPVCGKTFPYKHGQKYCSKECYNEDNAGKRPALIQLINDFKELENFLKVGEKYGVTDNTVRKWCKLYQLPFHTKELRVYINQYFGGTFTFPDEKVTKQTIFPIEQYDLNGNLLNVFDNARKAGEWLVENAHGLKTKVIKSLATSITRCANGQCETAYGYKWKKQK